VQLLAGAESSEHWKAEPLSLELKLKLAFLELVVLPGPELIEVLGGVVSAAEVTLQLRVAGEASVLPAASVAVTENAWEPTARPL
jgi:hypothetical protein